MHASLIMDRKWAASVSYRVPSRLLCFSQSTHRTTTLRPRRSTR
jgi:hypothetical protein